MVLSIRLLEHRKRKKQEKKTKQQAKKTFPLQRESFFRIKKNIYIQAFMHYELLCKNPEKSLTQRLLTIRNIESHSDHFLKPSFSHYRKDPFLLSDMKKATQRIQQAITKKENIMIFGDYDVDGITSSYCIYDFIKRHYQHHNISIMFPHRRNDGYGIKKKHIDIMKEKNI